MTHTDQKREKIGELLTYIEERLDELETEKEELKEFHESDKERRCLEYSLHNRELQEVNAALETIEVDRQTDLHRSNEQRKEFNQREIVVQVRTCNKLCAGTQVL